MTNLDSTLKSRDITLLMKVCIVKATVFLVVMYGCESWTRKKAEPWCFWIMGLEKTLESPLDSKEIKPVNPKGNQLWIFIGRTDTEAEPAIIWPPWCEELTHWKRPWCLKIERSEAKKKGEAQDEMVRQHHWLNGCESEQIPGSSNGQRSLACCSPWGRKESDVT